jgi:hypothetical protein
MAKLIRPVLFSDHFKISSAELDKRNLLDPILNSDTKVFIDPLLLEHCDNKIISEQALVMLREHFANVIKMLSASQSCGDFAWKQAFDLLNLSERRETCLGFGGKGVSGSSRSEELKSRILSTAHEILNLGVNDPELFALMGFLEDDVGPDTISDMTTNAIFPALASLTQATCEDLGVPMQRCWVGRKEYVLPINETASKSYGICLVPRDIVRDLPIAADMSDVSRVAFENAVIRDRVNTLLANFAKATVAEKKAALRTAALRSAKDFLDIFTGLKDHDEAYDPRRDADGVYMFRRALQTIAADYPFKLEPAKRKSQPELLRIVNQILQQFKSLIEDNDVGNLLWYKDSPRNEKAAQLLFFAVAEVYCLANNIDISPETHSGGGPVDFKFSDGHDARVLVEIKLSSGKVVHGYKTQLEVYRAANTGSDTILLVLRVGELAEKLKTIEIIRKARISAGEYASEIVSVDATRRPSASVR